MQPEYDLVVIGAGINGAGIARDAALRGLRVLLLDKGDFGSGTSSWSSRLIHGGLRYLEYGEIPLVFESLAERRRMRRNAPHLVKRLRLTIPIYEGSRRGRFVIRLGMIAYDLLSIGKPLPRHRMLGRDALIDREPGLNTYGLLGGAQYFDAQVTFAERLVLENVLSAQAAGADVYSYSPVIGLTVRAGRLETVQFLDAAGEEREVRAGMVVNAAGPWVDKVLATVNREMKGLMGGTKGSHIVVGAFDGAPQDAFYVEAQADGRPFFIIPWNRQFLIGTTDIRYRGDPADVAATGEEVDYLLQETNRVFPRAGLTRGDIHYAYAGVRPLPRKARGPESAITRRHIIRKHGRIAKGLVSIIGGKLTTYRNLAEQVVDFTVRKLKVAARDCATRDLPLPGGTGLDSARRELAQSGLLGEHGSKRMIGVYGGRAAAIVQLAAAEAGLATSLDEGRRVLAAEVAFVIRNELARNLTDIVHRRLMIGLDADQAAPLAVPVAEAAASELGWSRQETKRQLDGLRRYNARLRSFAGVD